MGDKREITRPNHPFWGAVYCTQHALPHLKETCGRILVVSSVAGLFPFPRGSGYAASKHALRGFFDSLRLEPEGLRAGRDRDRGVSVTLVYPGWVDALIRRYYA